MKKLFGEKKYGFTLSEVTIVLSLIGIIAAITIPSLSYRHQQAENKVKIKKAVSTFDSVLQSMASENFINNNSRLVSEVIGNNNNCQNIRLYLKTSGNGCDFRTSDGLRWHFENDNNNVIWARVDVAKSVQRQADNDQANFRSNKTTAYPDSAWFFATFVNTTIGNTNIPQLHANDIEAAKAIDGLEADADCGNGTACSALTNLNRFTD